MHTHRASQRDGTGKWLVGAFNGILISNYRPNSTIVGGNVRAPKEPVHLIRAHTQKCIHFGAEVMRIGHDEQHQQINTTTTITRMKKSSPNNIIRLKTFSSIANANIFDVGLLHE